MSQPPRPRDETFFSPTPKRSVAQSFSSSTLPQMLPHQLSGSSASPSGLATGDGDVVDVCESDTVEVVVDTDVDAVGLAAELAALSTLCVAGGSDGLSSAGASSSE